MQESSFWEGIDLRGLEELRLRLRRLVSFLDRKKQKIVYTDFQDQVKGVREHRIVEGLKDLLYCLVAIAMFPLILLELASDSGPSIIVEARRATDAAPTSPAGAPLGETGR